jgi:hypothetical protein
MLRRRGPLFSRGIVVAVTSVPGGAEAAGCHEAFPILDASDAPSGSRLNPIPTSCLPTPTSVHQLRPPALNGLGTSVAGDVYRPMWRSLSTR